MRRSGSLRSAWQLRQELLDRHDLDRAENLPARSQIDDDATCRASLAFGERAQAGERRGRDGSRGLHLDGPEIAAALRHEVDLRTMTGPVMKERELRPQAAN